MTREQPWPVARSPQAPRPNLHADGPFCRFGLPSAPHAKGVYAVFVSGTLQYIGECTDLAQRFGSSGYGLISPRNCHHDGQSTNCKLNSRVLAAAKSGAVAQVWFCATDDRKALETKLLAALSPAWNRRAEVAMVPRSVRKSRGTARRATLNADRKSAQGSGDFRTALSEILSAAERECAESLHVNAGSLHRRVGGYPGPHHRMPSCCAAMRSAMQADDRIVQQPAKGNGASLIVEYWFPRQVADAP